MGSIRMLAVLFFAKSKVKYDYKKVEIKRFSQAKNFSNSNIRTKYRFTVCRILDEQIKRDLLIGQYSNP